MDNNEYWKLYANQFIEGLTANKSITRFTKNPAIIGAYAEASIVNLITDFVNPLRCSTGSIITPALFNSQVKLQQLDLIIWNPTPLPAIFDNAGFALVPEQCVHGVLEIKRSVYSSVGESILNKLDWVEKYVHGNTTLRDDFTKKAQELIKKGQKNKLIGTTFQEMSNPDPKHLALGIICIREHKQTDNKLDELIKNGRAVVLQEIDNNGEIHTNVSHALHLIEFLKTVRIRANKKLEKSGISSSMIGGNLKENFPGSLSRK